MREFRDAKAMAQTLREALSARQVTLTHSESLEMVAKMLGQADWNSLSAAIKAAETKSAETKADEPPSPVEERAAQPSLPPAPEPPPPSNTVPRPRGGVVGYSATLEATMNRAVGLAAVRKHTFTTLEHLLLALIDDADAADVMRACEVDLTELEQSLTSYLDNELKALEKADGGQMQPTAGFQRVCQRAVIHVQSAGRDVVTGANILVAIFSERESHAAFLLQQQKMNRYDAVNYIANGVRKDGGRAA